MKLEEDDGSGGLQTVAEYQYDGLGRRTVKKTYAAGTLDETRHAVSQMPSAFASG